MWENWTPSIASTSPILKRSEHRCWIVTALPQWTAKITWSYFIHPGTRLYTIPWSIKFSQRAPNHISTKPNNFLAIISISVPIKGAEVGKMQRSGEEVEVRNNRVLGFVLIDFEKWCLSLLTLFYLSKKHVLVTCNKILLNIIAKITLRAKCDSLRCKVCSRII